MGRKEDGELGGICGYAKARYEERVEERRRKRSHSEAKEEMAAAVVPRKLHKAPQIQTLHERPERNRLRRKSMPLIETQGTQKRRNTNLYILEFDPYPYDTQPRQYMGAYSTINRVTAGAFEHGAYTFSKEGLLDGSEYLSPTGRIRIISLPVIRTGSRVTIAERSKSSNGEEVRLDIPHPQSQNNEATKDQSSEKTSAIEEDAKRVIFLAVRQGANNSSCIGIYSEKSLAWGACLKDKAMCAQTYSLSEEIRSIGKNNMPSVTAMLAGSGRYTWLVEGHTVDGARPKLPTTEPTQKFSGAGVS